MGVDSYNYTTVTPYKVLPHNGIEYTVCKDYNHISRYRRLRQVIHYLEGTQRFITSEIQNSYDYDSLDIEYYVVSTDRVNRLDLISYDYYQTTSYNWVIAYINEIADGYTVFEGQTLMIPKRINQLFGSGCVLASVPPTSLNLGTE